MNGKIYAGRKHSRNLCLVLFCLAATCGAFTGGLWASLGIGGALLLYGMEVTARRQIVKPDLGLAALIVVTLIVMAAAIPSSLDPVLSGSMVLRLASIFIPLVLWSCPSLLQSCQNPLFIRVVSGAAVVGALALGLELATGAHLLKMVKGQSAALTEYNRGLSYLVLLAFPLMSGLMHQTGLGLTSKQRFLAIVAFALIMLFPAGLTESRAAKLALVLGLGVTALAHLAPVYMRRCLSLLPFLLMFWPFLAQDVFRDHRDWLEHIPPSWQARMEIWDYMSYRIAERPWFGWGLGTSHLLPFRLPDGDLYVFTIIPASHPHNVFTELWAELGLPGLALGVAFSLLMLKKAAGLPLDRQPFALGAWMAALCLGLVAYDFWTDSLLAGMALTATAFSLDLYRDEKGHVPRESQNFELEN